MWAKAKGGFQSYVRWHRLMLQERPYVTNSITSGLLMLLGDRVAQRIEQKDHAEEGGSKSASTGPRLVSVALTSTIPEHGDSDESLFTKASLARSGIVTSWSATGALFWTYWYALLARRLPGRPLTWTLVTAVGPAPVMNAGFFTYSTVVDHLVHHGVADDTPQRLHASISDKLQTRWLQTVAISTQWWTCINALNFYLVPPDLRVLVGSGVALIWNVFLSWQQHRTPSDGAKHKMPLFWQPDIAWIDGWPRIVGPAGSSSSETAAPADASGAGASASAAGPVVAAASAIAAAPAQAPLR